MWPGGAGSRLVEERALDARAGGHRESQVVPRGAGRDPAPGLALSRKGLPWIAATTRDGRVLAGTPRHGRLVLRKAGGSAPTASPAISLSRTGRPVLATVSPAGTLTTRRLTLRGGWSRPARVGKAGSWATHVAPVLGLVGFIGFWYVMHYWALENLWDKPRFLITAPHRVVRESFLDTANLADLLDALLYTTIVAMMGLAVAIVVGMTLAICMAQASWIERSAWPYLVAVQAIPILALVPIIGSIFVARLAGM